MMWNIYNNISDSMECEDSIKMSSKDEENLFLNKKPTKNKILNNIENDTSNKVKIKIKIKVNKEPNQYEKYKNHLKNKDKLTISNLEKIEKKKDKCKYCYKSTLIFDESIICISCGMINSDIIDTGAEWRYYGSEDSKCNSDPNRCGMPINPLLPKSSFSTMINGFGREEYRRLHKWNSITYKERSLIKVFNMINTKSNSGIIPGCIIDKASLMYKLVCDENIKRGVARRSLIAACIWYALKAKNLSRSTKEIADLFDIDVKRLTSGCKDFTERMQKVDRIYLNNTLRPTSTKDYINRYSIKLGIPDNYKDIILRISEIIEKLGIVTKNTPQSIAVSSIYLISIHYNLNYSKKTLNDVCEISEVTISKAYKELSKYSNFLFQIIKEK